LPEGVDVLLDIGKRLKFYLGLFWLALYFPFFNKFCGVDSTYYGYPYPTRVHQKGLAMEEVDIIQRLHDPRDNDLAVMCTYQGKKRRVKVGRQIKTYLLIFFENTKNFSQKVSLKNPLIEDWIVREFILFSVSVATLQGSMTISTSDPHFPSFVYSFKNT
jgi:hypothetical protein